MQVYTTTYVCALTCAHVQMLRTRVSTHYEVETAEAERAVITMLFLSHTHVNFSGISPLPPHNIMSRMRKVQRMQKSFARFSSVTFFKLVCFSSILTLISRVVQLTFLYKEKSIFKNPTKSLKTGYLKKSGSKDLIQFLSIIPWKC